MVSGRCLVCGKPRPDSAVASGDPFCSSACCRSHYGVVDSGVGASDAEPRAVRVTVD
jgi:hypothetical protein